jgi:hypothetical protein
MDPPKPVVNRAYCYSILSQMAFLYNDTSQPSARRTKSSYASLVSFTLFLTSLLPDEVKLSVSFGLACLQNSCLLFLLYLTRCISLKRGRIIWRTRSIPSNVARLLILECIRSLFLWVLASIRWRSSSRNNTNQSGLPVCRNHQAVGYASGAIRETSSSKNSSIRGIPKASEKAHLRLSVPHIRTQPAPKSSDNKEQKRQDLGTTSYYPHKHDEESDIPPSESGEAKKRIWPEQRLSLQPSAERLQVPRRTSSLWHIKQCQSSSTSFYSAPAPQRQSIAGPNNHQILRSLASSSPKSHHHWFRPCPACMSAAEYPPPHAKTSPRLDREDDMRLKDPQNRLVKKSKYWGRKTMLW